MPNVKPNAMASARPSPSTIGTSWLRRSRQPSHEGDRPRLCPDLLKAALCAA